MFKLKKIDGKRLDDRYYPLITFTEDTFERHQLSQNDLDEDGSKTILTPKGKVILVKDDYIMTNVKTDEKWKCDKDLFDSQFEEAV